MNPLKTFNRGLLIAGLGISLSGFGGEQAAEASIRNRVRGTIEAGLAYAHENSAQISLAYRYLGIEYSAHNGRDGYSSTQNGVSMGFRWMFD